MQQLRGSVRSPTTSPDPTRSSSTARDTTGQPGAGVTPRCHGRVYGIQCSRPAEHAGEHERGSLRW